MSSGERCEVFLIGRCRIFSVTDVISLLSSPVRKRSKVSLLSSPVRKRQVWP